MHITHRTFSVRICLHDFNHSCSKGIASSLSGLNFKYFHVLKRFHYMSTARKYFSHLKLFASDSHEEHIK
jgi:hypothetical protein